MFRSAPNAGAGGATARRIKDWAREVFALDDDVTVLVSELACSEPGCPPVETVIAIFRGREGATKYSIHHPAAEVTRDHVARLAGQPSSTETSTTHGT